MTEPRMTDEEAELFAAECSRSVLRVTAEAEALYENAKKIFLAGGNSTAPSFVAAYLAAVPFVLEAVTDGRRESPDIIALFDYLSKFAGRPIIATVETRRVEP